MSSSWKRRSLVRSLIKTQQRLGMREYMLTKRGTAQVSMPVRLHLRTDLHLARKAWHLFMGLLMIAVYVGSGMSRTQGVVILGCLLGFGLFLEGLRLQNATINEKILSFWGPLMRRCEATKMSGVPYYVAATLLSIAIFPKPISILSVLYLACGDPIASIFGILYGERSLRLGRNRSLIGTAAGVLTCIMISFVFFSTVMHLPDRQLITLTLIGGLAGGLAELLPLDVDDNFSIPIVSGFILWLSFILLRVGF